MNRTALAAMLLKHEGKRLKVYKDSVGKLTVGIGRNLDDHGISEDECELMLNNDINAAYSACTRLFPGFATFSEARQHALIDMMFNLGEARLNKFEHMREAIEARDWEAAAARALNSKWASQVGARAKELAEMITHG